MYHLERNMTIPTPLVSPTRKGTDFLEGTAVSASLLCLVHCLALPLLVLLMPGTLRFLPESEIVHYLALALVAPFALVAFWLGFRQHRRARPAMLGAAGLGLLALGLWPEWSEFTEHAISVAGSVLLVTGHVLNWRLRICPVPKA
jgi:hypothetical protein